MGADLPPWTLESAEDWSKYRHQPGELSRRLCAMLLARTDKPTSGAETMLGYGKQTLLDFCSMMVKQGVSRGEDSCRDHVGELCAFVQSNFFDGITTDGHGASLRGEARVLNRATSGLAESLQFDSFLCSPAVNLEPGARSDEHLDEGGGGGGDDEREGGHGDGGELPEGVVYAVERVLAKRVRGGEAEYLVRWLGYGAEGPSFTHKTM